tara:strand:+ start:399 stop:671 length:273 start_codon:yes stop_codon:yes gene_type:complete
MANITVTLTDTQLKGLEYKAYSTQEYAENALIVASQRGIKEIISILVSHCNSNNIQLATGEDAQVQQAFDLGIVKTAEQRQIDAENELGT